MAVDRPSLLSTAFAVGALLVSAPGSAQTPAALATALGRSQASLPSFVATIRDEVAFPNGGEQPDPPNSLSWGRHRGTREFKVAYAEGRIMTETGTMVGGHDKGPDLQETKIYTPNGVFSYSKDTLQGRIESPKVARGVPSIPPLAGHMLYSAWAKDLLSKATNVSVHPTGSAGTEIECDYKGTRLRLDLEEASGPRLKRAEGHTPDGRLLWTIAPSGYKTLGAVDVPTTVEEDTYADDGSGRVSRAETVRVLSMEPKALGAAAFRPEWPESALVKNDLDGIVYKVTKGQLVESRLFSRRDPTEQILQGWAVVGGTALLGVLVVGSVMRKRRRVVGMNPSS